MKQTTKLNTIRALFTLSLPLILSNLNIALMSFSDRVFLGWLSPKALGAALPAGALSFGICAFFLGSAGYLGTFVAQYYGAKQKEKIGRMLWQGIWFSLLTLPLIPIFWYLAPEIFGPFQSDLETLRFEVDYFRRLMVGILPLTLLFVFSSVFSGQGKTWLLFWVNLGATVLNVFLDYSLIFGKFGFPEWGVVGAGWATVIAQFFTVFILVVLIFNKKNRIELRLNDWWFSKVEFQKLLKYGLPAGVHFFTDVISFTIFMLLIGTLGEVELAATNLAFQIHMLGFLPLTGIGIGVSIAVGQFIGANESKQVMKTCKSGMILAVVFMSIMISSYIVFPDFYLYFFKSGASDSFDEIVLLSKRLLPFCAFIGLFDCFLIILGAVLKGAGDTKFVMNALLLGGAFALVIPSYLLTKFDQGVFAMWWVFLSYMLLMAILFTYRLYRGEWKKNDILA